MLIFMSVMMLMLYLKGSCIQLECETVALIANPHFLFIFIFKFFFFVFFVFSRAAPAAWGGFQASGVNRSCSRQPTPQPQPRQI